MRRRSFHGLHRNVLLLGLLSPSQWSCKTWNRGAFRDMVDLLSSTIVTTEQAQEEETSEKRSHIHGLLGFKGAEKPSNKDVHLLCHVFLHNPWSSSFERNLRLRNFILTPHQSIQVLHILKTHSFSISLDFFIWSIQQRGFSQSSEACKIMKKSLEENLDDIQSLLKGMEFSQRYIPLVVFMLLMEIYAEKGMVEEAMETFNSINKYKCRPDEDAYDLVFKILVEKGKMDVAQNLFERMQRDQWCRPRKVTYYLLLYGLGKNAQLGEARKVIMEAMRRSKHEVVTREAYCHLVDGLCDGQQMCQAEEVVLEMYELGLEPDAHVYTSLVYGHANAGNIEESYRYYMDAIQDKLLTPSQEMFELLISGFCKHKGNVKVAYKLFREMVKSGIRFDPMMCNTLSRSMLEEKEWQVLEDFWNGTVENGIDLDAQICNEIVEACAGCNQTELALSIFNQVITSKGLCPNSETFDSLMRKLIEFNRLDYWEKLLTAIDNMKGTLRLEFSQRIMENITDLDQGVGEYISTFMEKRDMYKSYHSYESD